MSAKKQRDVRKVADDFMKQLVDSAQRNDPAGDARTQERLDREDADRARLAAKIMQRSLEKQKKAKK